MSNHIPNYLFHIPHTKKMLNYAELSKMMEHPQRAPQVVQVIDYSSRERLGSIPPHLALLKFR
jgi:hypothetical protein